MACSARTTVPYTEDLATQDWAPYSYLDGFWGDKTTKGSNQQRARLIVNGKKTTLEVELPKGCVATECGMQAKAVLSESLEEATMQYMCVSITDIAFKIKLDMCRKDILILIL